MENFNEDADIRDELLTNVGQAIAKAFYEFGDRDKRVIQNAAISNAVGVVADFFDSWVVSIHPMSEDDSRAS